MVFDSMYDILEIILGSMETIFEIQDLTWNGLVRLSSFSEYYILIE